MDNSLKVKEYKVFAEFYNICNDISCRTNRLAIHTISDKILYIRKTYDKNFLNGYCCIGRFPANILKICGIHNEIVKLSVDTLIKNIIEHPEIIEDEYLNIDTYLLNAEYILVKNEKNLIYFKIKNKIYQFVIKTTKDGSENFITTFHKASIKQLKKDLKRYKQI